MAAKFEKHKQPWSSAELERMRTLAAKGQTAKLIGKAIGRSEDSVKDRARADGVVLAKTR